jgi:hypothetical protein
MPDDAIPPGEDDPMRGGPESRPARDYEVGYGKPPTHTRFKKGESGNPYGRPSRHRNLATIFDAVLEEKVAIIENGRRRMISKRTAILKQVVNGALQEDPKATQILLRLLSQGDSEGELGQEPLTFILIGADARP